MKRKSIKIILPILIYVVLLIAACVGTAYLTVAKADMPISLPGKPKEPIDASVPGSSEMVMESWGSAIYHERKTGFDKIQDVIDEIAAENGETGSTDKVTNVQLAEMFPMIEPESLMTYIEEHKDEIKAGLGTLVIDKVDKVNTPTGIKTTLGDDVLAIDAVDGIVIIGRTVVDDAGKPLSYLKLAVVSDVTKAKMNTVSNLTYWDPIDEQAKETNAILAINASGYTWYESGNFAKLYGAMKYKGEVLRKANDDSSILGITSDGHFKYGSVLDNVYYGFETSPVMIDTGVVKDLSDNSSTTRCARSAVAWTDDNKAMFIIGSGGVYGSNTGAKSSELAKMMHDYGADNAVECSSGSRAIMYWNGRIVNETIGYPEDGVKLPNSLYIERISSDKLAEMMANQAASNNKTVETPEKDATGTAGDTTGTEETADTSGGKTESAEKPQASTGSTEKQPTENTGSTSEKKS